MLLDLRPASQLQHELGLGGEEHDPNRGRLMQALDG
jgi:hypothetical protein